MRRGKADEPFEVHFFETHIVAAMNSYEHEIGKSKLFSEIPKVGMMLLKYSRAVAKILFNKRW